MSGIDTRLPERFRSKVREDPSGCWIWTASHTDLGYGQFYFNGRVRMAHRVSYELLVGKLMPRLVVDHLCHTPSCVNPTHLRAATYKQNQENRKGAQRNSSSGARGVRQRGSRWEARARHYGRDYSAGTFDSLEEAAAAADSLREQLFSSICAS